MYYFTVTLIIILFIFDIYISYLNYKNRNATIPENVKDVYDGDEYNKWLQYTMEDFKLSIYSKIVNTIVLLGFFIFDIFVKLHELSTKFTNNILLQALIFLGLYLIVNFVVNLGFDLYQTFNLEQRYGFNRTTVYTYISDQIKSLVLILIIGGPLIYLLLFLYTTYGNLSILYSWLIFIGILLIINLLYTRLFIRLFNQITPLPQGELYEKATTLAKQLGYEIKTINVMDASKRSSRLNAFFTGFGKFKSIILYDTLLEKCSTDEIVSILAHEIGHARHKDTLKNLLISIIQIGAFLGFLTLLISNTLFSTAFGFNEINYGFSIILFAVLLEPVSLIINIPLSAHSRVAEFRADATAVEAGYKEAMITSLKTLAKENFANLTPHPLLVKLTYSHPTINQRITAINKL